MRANEVSEPGVWGEWELEVGQTGRWRIGPLDLWAIRQEREWRIAFVSDRSEESGDPEWQVDLEASMPAEPEHLERFAFSRASGRLRLRPALADRPVVTWPRIPLFVQPDERVELYVGSPLWLQVELGEPARMVRELPIRRPSDTWFGRTTGEGEICYATQTQATLDPQNLPPIARRAVTPVSIRNRAPSALRVERLKIPVPLLALYRASTGLLWTQAVTLVREEETEMANLDIREGAPPQAAGARQVAEAREQPGPGGLIRAFSSLF